MPYFMKRADERGLLRGDVKAKGYEGCDALSSRVVRPDDHMHDRFHRRWRDDPTHDGRNLACLVQQKSAPPPTPRESWNDFSRPYGWRAVGWLERSNASIPCGRGPRRAACRIHLRYGLISPPK
jgi:hypothetical protein